MTRENLSSQVVKTADVIGKEVVGQDEEKLGKIEEIVLDKVGGQVRYAVLSFGGFMGMGDKYFTVPWKSLHYNPTEEAFALNVSKEKLRDAPGFDKNNWPDMATNEFEQTIQDYYAS